MACQMHTAPPELYFESYKIDIGKFLFCYGEMQLKMGAEYEFGARRR